MLACSLCAAKDDYGGYLIGVGVSGGVGVNATPLLLSGQITYQYTKDGVFNFYAMKRNKRIVSIIVFAVIIPILTLVLMFTLQSKYIASLNREYKNIDTHDKIEGAIHSIKTRKGGAYITLDNKIKVHFYPSCNYLYKKIFLDDFLRNGDQLIKRKNSDTLYVYRNNQEYYFVLGKYINKK